MRAISPLKGRPDTQSFLSFKALTNLDRKNELATGVGKRGISRVMLNARLGRMMFGQEPRKVSRPGSRKGEKAKARETLARGKDEEHLAKGVDKGILKVLPMKARSLASSGVLEMGTANLEIIADTVIKERKEEREKGVQLFF